MKKSIWLILLVTFIWSCKKDNSNDDDNPTPTPNTGTVVETAIGSLELAEPYATESAIKPSELIGWPAGKLPQAPAGFTVSRFADNLEHPRWTYVAPNNDIFVAESNTSESANRITLLRDTNNDGNVDERFAFLENLNQPLGMLVLGNFFYVANTDGVYKYPYTPGINELTTTGQKIVDLTSDGYNNHWTRNIIANNAGDKIYISVGSASNVGEDGAVETRRANILEVNLDGSGEKIFASGIRNPVGMDWNPITGDLWTAVNERDGLGDELVPDYVTSVKEGGWYGWPYSYFGKIKDPRWTNDPHDDLVNQAIIPDVPLGSHTASLGLTFYTANQFPQAYKNGAFVGQHGSWNRAKFSGYKVVFIPFAADGKPKPPEDFLTGFIADEAASQVYGRPAGVTVAPDGSLLVNDDDGGIIWKVKAN